MVSTATSRLRLNKQGTGDNTNTWGTTLNGQVFDLLDEAIGGVETISLTGNKTLTATNYASDEARNFGLKFTDGGLASAPTVTLPSVEKVYFIINDTGYTITFDAGGTTADVETGRRKMLAVDASSNIDIGEDGLDLETGDARYLKLAGGAVTGNVTVGGTLGVTGATTLGTLSVGGASTLTGVASYATDLSGSYTDRSLVDKAYVNSVALGSVSVSFDWTDVTNKPTTIAGYGITDAYTDAEVDTLLTGYQPLDSDLMAIAALSTDAYGRNALIWNEATTSGDVSPAVIWTEYLVDTGTAARSITLPAGSDGARLRVSDKDGNASSNNITVTPDGSETIMGRSTLTIDINFAGLEFRYRASATDWELVR